MWLKFVYLEELLQNIAGARQVFERWMKWEPDDKGSFNSTPPFPFLCRALDLLCRRPLLLLPISVLLIRLRISWIHSLAGVHQGSFTTTSSIALRVSFKLTSLPPSSFLPSPSSSFDTTSSTELR